MPIVMPPPTEDTIFAGHLPLEARQLIPDLAPNQYQPFLSALHHLRALHQRHQYMHITHHLTHHILHGIHGEDHLQFLSHNPNFPNTPEFNQFQDRTHRELWFWTQILVVTTYTLMVHTRSCTLDGEELWAARTL
ncbi:hypothetical protein BDN72DRAFT_896300 [Pluteus cervinus]|uniref:Uncharacterized protein n=1 Tax=Pluteus cervinus TaxID=181527 RepID=A0ACD3AY02_9AGAR|nr:hypothetical protein BDN72DRAFT_896300 [Pluteus cervinus]